MADVAMPRLGLTMRQGKIVRWLKDVGNTVRQGEPLVEVLTEKVTVVVESPHSGIVQAILADVGTEQTVGAVIAKIAIEKSEFEEIPHLPVNDSKGSADVLKSTANNQKDFPTDKGELRISPAAKRAARELGLSPEELYHLQGSGPGGRIVASDVQATPLAKITAARLGLDSLEREGSGPYGKITQKDVLAASEMRTVIARRMSESWQNAPQVTFSRLVNAASLVDLKAQCISLGVVVTYTDILVKVIANTLRAHPRLRAFAGDEGRLAIQEAINIGLAVAVPDGLLVPVVRQADRLSLAAIATLTKDLGRRAREQALQPDDLSEGVFTLTNLGMYGVDHFTAILNPPQTGILAVGRIADTVIAQNGQAKITPAFWLTLGVDHRAVNGSEAATFLDSLTKTLENPLSLLL